MKCILIKTSKTVPEQDLILIVLKFVTAKKRHRFDCAVDALTYWRVPTLVCCKANDHDLPQHPSTSANCLKHIQSLLWKNRDGAQRL